MKPKYFTLLSLLLLAHTLWATVTPGVTLTTYYANADGKCGNALRTALGTIISTGYTAVSYDNIGYLLKYADTQNADGKTLIDIYSPCSFDLSENTDISWSGSCSGKTNVGCGLNREHTLPQSWFAKATPMVSDAFHIYATDAASNGHRSDTPYGECNGTSYTGSSCNESGDLGTSTFSGYSGNVYEPADEYKGDIARGYFYMLTRYRTTNFNQGAGSEDDVCFSYTDGQCEMTDYMLALMLKWHRQDPVSEKELIRNEVIYGNSKYNKGSYKQNNRNPFIDYPDLVEYIWGNKKTTNVSLSSLTPAYQSAGSTSTTTYTDFIVVCSDTYTVTYDGNGKTSGSVPTDATDYTSGATVTVKTNSGNLAKTGYTFSGWNTKADGSGTTYAAGTGTFSISANTTLYAKWTKNPYTVTYNLTNVTKSSGCVDNTDGSSTFNAYFTANTGYELPSSVTVTVGGGTGTYTWVKATGQLVIKPANITGNIVITISGTSSTPAATLYTYHTPACCTDPVNLSTSTGPGVKQAAAIEGYTFEGWTTNSSYTRSTTAPSPLYKAGDQPGGTIDLYAVYSDDGSKSISSKDFQVLKSGSDVINSGEWYAVSNGQSGSSTQYVLGNEIYEYNGGYSYVYGIGTAGSANSDVMHVNSTGSVFLFEGNATNGYTMKNYLNKKYLAISSDANNHLTYVAEGDITNNARWTITLVNSGEHFTTFYIKNKGASSSLNLKYVDATNPYWTNNTSQQVVYLFHVSIDPGLDVVKTYTIDPTCPKYKVTYSKGTGTGSVPTDNTEYDPREEVTVKFTPLPTKTGYNWVGWTDGDDEHPYTPDGYKSFLITQDVTLTAMWEAKTTTITFDKQSGTGGSNSVTATYGQAMPSATMPTRTGYSFGGYYTETDGAGTQYYTSTGASARNWNIEDATKTLYAKWTPNTYTLAYDANGGTGTMTESNSPYNNNAVVTVKANEFTAPAGKKFNGWNTVAGGTGTSYAAGATFNITANTTLYAQWTDIAYSGYVTSCSDEITLSYNMNGHGTQIDPVSPATAIVIPSPAPTETGWTFGGWYTDAGLTAAAVAGTAVSENTTLYAKWTAVQYTVTYSVPTNGGTASRSQDANQTSGTVVQLPTVTGGSLACARFIGWYADDYDNASRPGSVLPAGDDYTITATTTLKAMYAIVGDGYSVVKNAGDLAVGQPIIIVANGYNKAVGATTSGNNQPSVDISKDGDALSSIGTACEFELQAGKNSGQYAFHDASYNSGAGGYLYMGGASSSNYLKILDTKNDARASWTITITDKVATVVANGTGTRNEMRYNNTSDFFSCYANSSTLPSVQLYQQPISKYTTAPTCTQYDVTLVVTGHASGSAKIGTLTATPGTNQTKTIISDAINITDIVDVAGYSYTVAKTSGTATVTNNGDGTASVTGISTDVTITVTYTSLPQRDITFNVGNGTGSFTALQTYNGGSVTIPAEYVPTPACGTFVGWSETQATGAAPAVLYKAGDSYTLPSDANRTLYAVYAVTSGCVTEFSLGTSTTNNQDYQITAVYSGTKYWACTKNGSNYYYANTESQLSTYAASKFRLTYAADQSNPSSGIYKYAIHVSNGDTDYGYMTGTSNSIGISSSSTAYYWTIKAGANPGEFTIMGDSYYFICNGSNFNLRSSSATVKLETGASYSYYTSPDCGASTPINATFESNGMTIEWNADPSWNEASDYEGLDRCGTVLNIFPEVTPPTGWNFIGWSTTDYSTAGGRVVDDENASADLPSSTIYKTGGNSFAMEGNTTFYPVCTKFEDNEPINLTTGGDYYIYFYREDTKYSTGDAYFAVDNHYTRIYADYTSGTAMSYTKNCASARIFEFVKRADGYWNIRLKNADGTYPKTSYLTNASGNDLGVQSAVPGAGWQIQTQAAGNVIMHYRGNGHDDNKTDDPYYFMKAQENASSWTFKCYNKDTQESSYYYKIYLGTCEERVFSSNPSNMPTVNMTGNQNVTSAAGKTVRGAEALVLNARKLTPGSSVTIASGSEVIKLSTSKDASFADGMAAAKKPQSSVTLTADANGKIENQQLYVHYTPTATDYGTEDVTITATYSPGGGAPDVTATVTISCRHLSDRFVIVTKVGEQWLALPADLSSSTPAGIPVEVDNATDPSAVTSAPKNTAYALGQVYTVNGSNDRYCQHGEANYFAAANNGYKGLKASPDEANISNDAVVIPASALTAALMYEWELTTTDLKNYTIYNRERALQLKYYTTNAAFGLYTSSSNVVSEFRLLPATFVEPAEIQIVEWKTNAVVVMYAGGAATATTKVGTNSFGSAQTLSSQQVTQAVYTLNTAQSLVGNHGKTLTIKMADNTQATYTIPIIVNGAKTDAEAGLANAANNLDVVVLKGATLTATATADGSKYRCQNLTIYGGGKVFIDEGKYLGVNSLTMRIGGVADGEFDYVTPEFVLKGTCTNSSSKICLDYLTTATQYHSFAVPFAVSTESIKYPLDIYGDNVTGIGVKSTNTGSFGFQYYDAKQRATGASGWKDLAEPATLQPGTGYTFFGMPKKVSVNGGAAARQKFGIHRITISQSASDIKTHENANQSMSVTVYGDENTAVNDRGWVLLGNPYMASLSGDMGSGCIRLGMLEKEIVNGAWTGGWVVNAENEKNVRYITQTNDGVNYTQTPASSATIKPFSNFFVQLEKGGTITFAQANRPASAPARMMAVEKEIETGIMLESATQADRTGLLIASQYTEAYDFNADLSKWMNAGLNLYSIGSDGALAYMAVNSDLAAQPIPLGYTAPEAGNYTFSFDDERYAASAVSSVSLVDYTLGTTTDLLLSNYTFSSLAGTFDARFALSVIPAEQLPQTPTSYDQLTTDDWSVYQARPLTLTISGVAPGDRVRIFDSAGRMVAVLTADDSKLSAVLPARGLYIVERNTLVGVSVKKCIIK